MNLYLALLLIVSYYGTLKAIQWHLNKNSSEPQGEVYKVELRRDLMIDLNELRREIRKTEEEVRDWRTKYYDTLDELLNIQMDQVKAPPPTTPPPPPPPRGREQDKTEEEQTEKKK